MADADEAVFAKLSEELVGEYTWEEMTERFNEKTGKNMSTPTVFRFCKAQKEIAKILKFRGQFLESWKVAKRDC